MISKPKRAALYLRVSTDKQTTENQRLALSDLAAQRGWTVVKTYEDAGISGAKSRDKRPGLDSMLNDAVRGQFDVVLAWSVDRLGRSLSDLVSTFSGLHDANVALVLHQQAVDTTTPAGRAMLQMIGVFAEFERSMIQARVVAGMARARAQGKTFGRKSTMSAAMRKTIISELESGVGIVRLGRMTGVGTGTIHKIARELRETK
jgi:DNA invertase Pin-like site-specific DNA recombinase